MRFCCTLTLTCAVLFTLPTWAHHSHGNYSDIFTDIEGVVTEIHFLVPHSWVYLEVTDDDGQPQVWALEATSRRGLENVGVTPEYVEPGDNVKVRCHPVRDGSNGCLLGFLKAPDGSVKDWDGGDAPPPADF